MESPQFLVVRTVENLSSHLALWVILVFLALFAKKASELPILRKGTTIDSDSGISGGGTQVHGHPITLTCQDVSLGAIIFDSEEGERAITYIPSSLDAGKLILRNVSYVYAIFESDAPVADVTRKARVHAIKRGDIALILSNRHIGMNKRTYVEIDIYNRASMGFLRRCVIIGRLDHDSMENICNIKAEDSFTGSGPVGKLRISLSS